ncbi:FMN-linked oxidoreductase [Marasmius fiardii PR-910]|nr:FMN-linked oxidoreductase [Marasmius fiardii PR-910]
MVKINTIVVQPAVVNSSCAWASDYSQLHALYECAHTGAVTTRTATLDGFKEDESHAVAFSSSGTTSLNSYGYSPHPLSTYLEWIRDLLNSAPRVRPEKPFIISITASKPADLERMIQDIQVFRISIGDNTLSTTCRIAVELNTSCPNIPGAPPSAYTPLLDTESSLASFLKVLSNARALDKTITIGIKLPPFVYRQQFVDFIQLLKSEQSSGMKSSPFSFLTCTNTLGNSLLFLEGQGKLKFGVPPAIGGLAGEALHPLALGNVFTFRELLKEDQDLKNMVIIGVGGVTSSQAARRMHEAGASVVGCATLLGKEGIKAFEIIST